MLPKLIRARALVTGGAGFIGSHLVDRLLESGAEVVVLDNFATGRRENLSHCLDAIELIEGDIRELDVCRQAMRGVQFVFHQAALGSVPRSMKEPATSLEVNVQGTTHVLTAAQEASVKRFVFASSSSVYGDSQLLPKREGEEGRPMSPYAASKMLGEELAEVFDRCYGLDWVGLRYFNIFGPRQDPEGPYAAVIPKFFQATLRRESPVIFGDGEQSRDFTFVADCVQANLLAAGAPHAACGRAYNVGAGRGVTVNELAETIATIVGSDSTPAHQEPRAGDVRHSLADLAQVRSALGYEPQRRLSDGLAACQTYYRELLRAEGTG